MNHAARGTRHPPASRPPLYSPGAVSTRSAPPTTPHDLGYEKYVGVCWTKREEKGKAATGGGKGKKRDLGCFVATEEEAAEGYQVALKERKEN